MKKIKGMEEAKKMIEQVRDLDGEHIEVVYDPEVREVYPYEVTDDHSIETDDDKWSFGVASVKDVEKHISQIDDFIENYKNKMTWDEYLMTVADF